MDISRRSCRICLSETEFNVSLFGNYCRRTNIADKILVCVKIVIEETDNLNTICYKCAGNIERYYNFIMLVNKSQMKLAGPRTSLENSLNVRHVTSYVREQVVDADYTFSFLEIPNKDEKKETKGSSPLFSYFSPPNVLLMPSNEKKESETSSPFFSYFKQPGSERVWKTPRSRDGFEKQDLTHGDKVKYRKPRQDRSRRHSGDLFDSQSQDIEEPESRNLDWKLTPDDNIIKRVRNKFFGRSDF